MTILYLLGIRIFYLLVLIASIFNSKAKQWHSGRKKIFQRLKESIKNDDKVAWFHCASLGEFEQARPLIEGFKKKYPDHKILLTFYSPSGYEIRKKYEKVDFVFYLPLDTPRNARRFLNVVKPNVVFFIKYEFWYFFLREIGKRDIPLYLVSGIFRMNQRFFRPFGVKSRKMLSWFTHFFVQNEESKDLLLSIDHCNVLVTGDTRFDRVFEITKRAKELPLIERFTGSELVIVVGSSWKPDEEFVLDYIKETNFTFKLIIAPHEIHKENIQRIIKRIPKGKQALKYSEANELNVTEADILIIDSIGLLSSIYKYGSIAYIGGGFGKGIHNILEAATFGLPIIFGPNYKKFKEAIELKELGGAISIENYSDLRFFLNDILRAKSKIHKKGQISSKYIEDNKGATDFILEFIKI